MPEQVKETSGSAHGDGQGVSEEVTALLAELAEMSRRISAQLDVRAAKLQDLIRQADARIEKLSGLDSTPAAQADDLIDVEPAHEAVAVDPNANVYALADEGRSAGEIASRLGRPKGEIELILALRR